MRLLLMAAALAAAAGPLQAQDLAQDLAPVLDAFAAQDQSLARRSVQIILLITVLSILPGVMVTVTCFPFMVTVLSILRQALGMQQSPPNMVMVSLALFLTWFVMEPTLHHAWRDGVEPYAAGEITLEAAAPLVAGPFRDFMAARLDPDNLIALAEIRGEVPGPEPALSLLVPAFLLSEIERAFQIGFLVFLPFLIIDLVVAAVLMSMGMMMVPPAIVALPFKLAFFVAADGWALLAGALVRGYG